MLCWGLVEQARHKYMSSEYKNQYIVDVPLSSLWMKVRDTTEVPSEPNKRGKSQEGKLGSQIHIVYRNYGNHHSILLVRIVY